MVSCLTSDYFIIIQIPGVAGTAYLACDDEPVTREEICAAALASGKFPGLKMPQVRTLRKAADTFHLFTPAYVLPIYEILLFNQDYCM